MPRLVPMPCVVVVVVKFQVSRIYNRVGFHTGPNPVYILLGLTPTDEGDKDQVFGGNFCKYDDQLLEHEEGLCPHPHDCDEGEVVDQ